MILLSPGLAVCALRGAACSDPHQDDTGTRAEFATSGNNPFLGRKVPWRRPGEPPSASPHWLCTHQRRTSARRSMMDKLDRAAKDKVRELIKDTQFAMLA